MARVIILPDSAPDGRFKNAMLDIVFPEQFTDFLKEEIEHTIDISHRIMLRDRISPLRAQHRAKEPRV